jgi:UDP-N-acetylmuramyl tripeptide synthase
LTVAESGNLTITKGATSDLIVTNADCSLKFDVAGTTANALAGQSCTVVDADGTEVDTYNAAVITSTDGVTSHLSATLTAAISSGGQIITCTGTESADLQKL